ncbi:bifunctional adenosylcobinamide kinase/adenosylcobinamide-phosphate guanylyltransferase [Nocardioides zeae]|uniref:Adenosylcobinamide kinase n=1 Tax=Nocardioides imazamoxiresistens TaxID=3231893 RepID=A0ABU3PV20_9ACTN|nr:bifunctional adenosylcobinamide kinase/adenosylcobinamide-phosphate guanylyltransferase [Nocardioides zeae]MDT9592605.1 bifunctional adenosylcobinamide kinase/adenosylcobinamide-phosphate guanylyltransferase [Nocardioides zeae]
MSVRLLGTGAADGWPQAFCRCASCGSERAAGRVRSQTAALLDRTVLLDCGPTTPEAAQRAGVDLADVRVLLLTHQHSDHLSPAALMHRGWVTDAPLVVAGPPDAVAAARAWLPPDAPVRWLEVAPGERHDLEGYAVRVLAAAHRTGLGEPGAVEAVLYDVTTPDGVRVLHATDTGPLPAATLEATAGAAYDVVLLEETFGDRDDLAGDGHHGLSAFAATVRGLRASGAVVATTDLVAVHLSHHNPPTPELARRLAAWGARVVDDGTLVGPGGAVGPAVGGVPGGRTLVLGGARSGKSVEAERLLTATDQVAYVATSYPRGDDPEWVARVETHVQRRPAHWTTVETLDLVGLLEDDDPAALLVDCLTLWLTRVIDRHDAWDPAAPSHADAWAGVESDVADLLRAWRTTARHVVAVSNEVGQGVVPATASGRMFRDAMGRLNAAVAAASEDVRWCVAGRVVAL